MADYKRMVSYIYSYDNGVKMNNVGFAKLEARNEQLKITVNIKNIHIGSSKPYKVYLFERGNVDEIKGVLIGELTVINASGEFKGTTTSSNIMNSGADFKNCVGIIIENSSDKSYATGWDDKPIKISKLVTINLTKEVKEDITPTNEPKNYIEDSNMDITQTTTEEYANNLAAEFSENDKNDTEIPLKETSIEDTLTDNNQYDNSMKKEISDFATNISNNKSYDKDITEESLINYKPNPYIIPQNTIQEDTLQNSSVNDTSHSKDTYSNKPNHKAIIENELFGKYPRLYPFEDKEIFDCIRIEPQDIGSLPMETWILGNNSFLLHGYYNYRHLLLGKINSHDAPQSDSCKYIIGVPGVYHNREKFMAKMFGFELFKPAKIKEQKTGEFGYWYMFISL